MSSENLQHILTVAKGAAEKAANNLRENFSKYRQVKSDVGRDIKIEADRQLEAVILEELSRGSGYSVLSEESGLVQGLKKDSSYRWIVDPFDGSFNFSRGIPLYCISVAFWNGMEPLVGVVYDFQRHEMFCGIVGEGTWLNDKAVHVSSVKEKSKAVLCTGFPSYTDFSKDALLDFTRSAAEYKKVRLFGSAALSLAYVSCGRADVYEEKHIKLWDVAAGMALVKAAGGVLQCRLTEKENAVCVRACNPNLL